VTFHDDARRIVDVAASTRITHPLPFDEKVGKWTLDACRGSRSQCDETLEPAMHTTNIRLLQHDLGHENVPRIARCAPRKITQTRETPRQQFVGDPTQASQAELTLYGRLRSGAFARFHTITRRRK